jgi:hypothetical protein
MAKPRNPKFDAHAALDTWLSLNEALQLATQADCEVLMGAERRGKARPTFLRRIHSRLNKVRADAERALL